MKISYARRAIAVSLTVVTESAGALDLEARGFAARGVAGVLLLERVVVLEVVRFMTLIVATSMPVVPVPATVV